MMWNPNDVLNDFAIVACLAGVMLKPGGVRVETMTAHAFDAARYKGRNVVENCSAVSRTSSVLPCVMTNKPKTTLPDFALSLLSVSGFE